MGSLRDFKLAELAYVRIVRQICVRCCFHVHMGEAFQWLLRVPVRDLRKAEVLAQHIADPLGPFADIVPDTGIGLTVLVFIPGQKPHIAIQADRGFSLAGPPGGFSVRSAVNRSGAFLLRLQEFAGMIGGIVVSGARCETQALPVVIQLRLHPIQPPDFLHRAGKKLNIEIGQSDCDRPQCGAVALICPVPVDADLIVFPVPVQLEIADFRAVQQVLPVFGPRTENIFFFITVAQIQVPVHQQE